GLNSIVGGKGVGKSLIIELIRFALHDPPEDPALLTDHHGKLEACLKVGDSVEIVYETESGSRFRVCSTYQGQGIEPVRSCMHVASGENYTGSIPVALPVLAYSQTEIIKIAETKGAQLALIDRFLDADQFRRKFADLNRDLREN